jgi:hypothetical protein
MTRSALSALLIASLLLLVSLAAPAHCVSLQPGWPQVAGGAVSSPVLADLDGDGDLEVIVGSVDDRVYAWHHDGTPVAGWPRSAGDDFRESPAVADTDHDGHPEIVAGSLDQKVYAWHADGTPVAGWPQTALVSISQPPALGDIDGDGGIEVVSACDGYIIEAWHADGTPVVGWPKQIPNISPEDSASPARCACAAPPPIWWARRLRSTVTRNRSPQ